MRKFLVRFWPLAAIFTIVAIFFYPVWLQNKIPLPADFVIGTYYPWLDYKWGGYGAGVPVKNPITTDVVSFIFPMQMLSIDLLKQGIIPLWNENILTGTPLLANFQGAPFSPTNIFFFLFPKLDAWSLQIILQPFLAALFTFLFLRQFNLSKIASVFGGISFAFAGFNTIWMQWNGHALTAAFFPLIFLLVLKWLKEPKLLWGVLFSICFTLQIFSGYPQIILYEMLGILVVCVFHLNLKKMTDLGFFILLGIGLAGIQIIPALELLRLSQRSVEDVLNVPAFLPWQYLITFLAPDYFGNHATMNFWGKGDYTLVTGFSGVVTIFLAGIALLGKTKNLNVLLGLSFIVLALLISLPNPLSILLKESGLLGLQAASAHRSLVLSNLGFAILAAFGFEMLRKKEINLKIILRSSYIPAILLVGFLIGTFISYKFLQNSSEVNLHGVVQNIINFKVGLRNLVLPIIILITTTSLCVLSLKIRSLARVVSILIFTLSIFELFRFGWKFTPFSAKEFVLPTTPVIEFLQKNRGNYRVTGEDVIPINLMMPYKIQTIEGYDAVYPLRTAKYLSVLKYGHVEVKPLGRYGSVNNLDSNLLNLVSVKYVLALKRDKIRSADENGSIPDEFKKPFLVPVFEDKTVVILENKMVTERVGMYYDWEVIPGEKQILERLNSKDFPNDKKIVLENEPVLDKKPDSLGKVSFKEVPNGKLLTVETKESGLVFIADTWFPGWRAFIDGQEIPILRANYNFMAVAVKAGTHQINFEYKPTSFEIGKMLSFFSATILLICCITSLIKKYARTS